MLGNSIPITGDTFGIGLGLAEGVSPTANQVVTAGRREDCLQQLCQRNTGMAYFVLDVTKPEAIHTVASQVIERFPNLNCVINNAGIQMHIEYGLDKPLDEEKLQAEITTNLLAPIRVAAACRNDERIGDWSGRTGYCSHKRMSSKMHSAEYLSTLTHTRCSADNAVPSGEDNQSCEYCCFTAW